MSQTDQTMCDERSRRKIRDSLLKVVPGIFDKTPVLFAYLYESYASGVVHPYGDLDIGIYVETMPIREYLNLELSISLKIDEKLGHRVASEVRVTNTLPLVIIGKIITEGVLIFSRNDIMRVDFETSVRSAFFDFLPILRRYQRAYIDRIVS